MALSFRLPFELAGFLRAELAHRSDEAGIAAEPPPSTWRDETGRLVTFADVLAECVEGITGLFGLDEAASRACRSHAVTDDRVIAIDLSDSLLQWEPSVTSISKELLNRGNLSNVTADGLQRLLRNCEPLVFLFDLTLHELSSCRKEWCREIGQFLKKYGLAHGGHHTGLVLLQHRHRFTGQRLESYFEETKTAVTWFRTSLVRADSHHPDDTNAGDYVVSHRLEDLAKKAASSEQKPVPRQWLRDELKDWVSDESGGLTVIRGDMGTGKSVLMGELLSRWFDEPGNVLVVRGFKASKGKQPYELLNSLCFELLWQLGLDGRPGEERNPNLSSDPEDSLRRWFDRLLATVSLCLTRGTMELPFQREDKPLWESLKHLFIAIDALDESDPRADVVSWICDILPRSIPAGVYVLVSGRPGFVDRLTAERKPRMVDLSPAPDQSTDAGERITAIKADAKALVEQGLARVAPPDGDYVNRVTHIARGNLLCAALIIRYIDLQLAAAAPAEWDDYFCRLESSQAGALKDTFREIFDAFWKVLDRRVSDSNTLREALATVTGVLAIAQQPVSVRLLSSVTGLKADLVQRVLGHFTATGLARGEDNGDTRVYHIPEQWFREYLENSGVPYEGDRRKLPADSKECHANIGRWCKTWDNQNQTSVDRTYKLRCATHHLIEADQWDQVYGLLVSLPDGKNFEYLEARMVNDQGSHGLVDDFRRILACLSEEKTISLSKNERTLLEAFGRTFIREQHTFADDPERCFQQMYGPLRWFKDPSADSDCRWIEDVRSRWNNNERTWLRPLTPPRSDNAWLTLVGHKSRVTSVAFSPDGKRVVSGSSDSTCRLWDAKTGQELQTLRGHTNTVNCVAFSPDGERVVSGSGSSYTFRYVRSSRNIADNTCRIWDAETGQEILTLRGHTDRVLSVAFSPDGRRVVSGSWDGTCKIWDAKNGDELRTLRGHTELVMSVAFSPDGRRVVSVSGDATCRVWDAETGEELQTRWGLGNNRGNEFGVVSPDGRWIISDSNNTCLIWDAVTGSRRPKQYEFSTIERERCVAISADGRRIVSGNQDFTVRWGDVGTGTEQYTLHGHSGTVNCVAISPDGCWIVSGSDDGTCRVWDVETSAERPTHLRTSHYTPDGTAKTTLKTEYNPLIGNGLEVRCIAFAPDDSWIVSGSDDGTCRVWDVSTGAERRALRGHWGYVWSVAVSPDGRRIVSGSGDGTFRVWDANTGIARHIIKHGYIDSLPCVAICPKGRLIAGSADPSCEIWTWDAETGEEQHVLQGHTDEVSPLAFSQDGRRVVSGSKDKTCRLWDAERGKEVHSLQGHTEKVNCVAFSPDGCLIVSGSSDCTCRAWDVGTGTEQYTLHGHSGPVNCVAFSPDGRWIVSGSSDCTCRVWNAQTGVRLHTLQGHTNSVTCVAISTDGRWIISGSSDGTCRVWDCKKGCCEIAFHAKGRVYDIGLSHACDRLLAATASGLVLLEVILPSDGIG